MRKVLDTRGVGEFALFALLFAAKLPYIGLRAVADNGRSAVDGATYERDLFGGLPTLGLQDRLFGGHDGFLEQVAGYFHMSWFFFPGVITLVVLFRYRSEFGSYATWYLACMYAAVALFFVFPMQPPWMADDSVSRILTLRWGSEVHVDNNPVAAFPSLHVALPLTLALWAHVKQHRLLFALAFGFSVLTAMNVVFLGEHYVIDVLAAVLLAFGICVAMTMRSRIVPVRMRGWTMARAEGGQTLVEFAFALPLMAALVGAIITIGLALHTRSNLQQAVREAARQAAVGNFTEARNIGSGNAAENLDPDEIEFCFPTGSDGSVGDEIRAFVDQGNNGSEGYSYAIIPSGGLFAAFGWGADVVMKPQATARLEKSATEQGISPCTT